MENFQKWNPKKDITGNGCHLGTFMSMIEVEV
jgi:hypothetical protein